MPGRNFEPPSTRFGGVAGGHLRALGKRVDAALTTYVVIHLARVRSTFTAGIAEIEFPQAGE